MLHFNFETANAQLGVVDGGTDDQRRANGQLFVASFEASRTGGIRKPPGAARVWPDYSALEDDWLVVDPPVRLGLDHSTEARFDGHRSTLEAGLIAAKIRPWCR
jgi:hypothetical protein